MTIEEFAKYAEKIQSAAGTAAGIAGAGGYTVGAAIQGYKDGKTGDTTRYRQINDIEVSAGIDETTNSTLKTLAILAAVGFVVFIIYKRRNK